MGPAPKSAEQQRRRGRGLGNSLLRLPAAGREGDPPTWPLSKPTKLELAKWDRLWRTPQAVAWERLGWHDVVARYTRQLIVAERRKPPVPVLMETRQLEDRLGLTPMAMLRLRWEVTEDLEVDGDRKVLDIRTRMEQVAD